MMSPYVRTKETFNGIAAAYGGIDEVLWIEEPRLREIEYGNYDRPDITSLHREKQAFGAFYYRYPEGESPADVYDRACSFIESLFRMWQVRREDNYVIIGHGVMLNIFIQRFFGMTIDEYYALARLDNCEFVVFELNAIGWYGKVSCLRHDLPDHPGLRMGYAQPSAELWNPVKSKSLFSSEPTLNTDMTLESCGSSSALGSNLAK